MQLIIKVTCKLINMKWELKFEWKINVNYQSWWCLLLQGSGENVTEDNQSRIEVQALEKMLNFESFEIEDDGQLEGIFLLEGFPSSRQQIQLSSKLEDLTLTDLPKLRHICRTPPAFELTKSKISLCAWMWTIELCLLCLCLEKLSTVKGVIY